MYVILAVMVTATVQGLEDKRNIMEIIETTAPISIEDLKKYFVNKETKYLIDYSNSKLKGAKLLTYLSNLDIPADIKIAEAPSEEFFELVKEYFNSPFIVSIPSLEKAAIYVLFCYRGFFEDENFVKFITENKDIIKKWATVLDSLTLFNMYIVNVPEFKEFVTGHPHANEDDKLTGMNFVNLLKHEEFYDFYSKVNESELQYYHSYFNDYMFKGKNLFEFWATEKNFLFLLTYNIAGGNFSEAMKGLEEHRKTNDPAIIDPTEPTCLVTVTIP